MSLGGYGATLSEYSQKKYRDTLVEFADSVIREMSHFSFDPNELVRVKHDYTPAPMPKRIADAKRI